MFGDADAVRQISDLVAEYPSIWESQGFVQIPPERWMKVPLKPGWEAKVSAIKPKVYPLGNDARRLVDNTFNELHQQGRMKFMSNPTSFSFPIFVVWKSDSEGKKKGHAVVDIRKLNNLVLPDSYPLPLQSEIIANVQGCTNLAVLDAASFFYHWRLHPDHRFMFTVVTDRGQETFQVPIMGYINSVAYVQREIDNILREVRAWARAYVDDIICSAKSLPDLLSKLQILFDIFLRYNISIKPTKFFLNYPDVGFLGQRVNSLGLTSSDEKLKAIRLLAYPDTLGALEYYLGLTEYLRSYIHFYAQLAAPLQKLKTSLLRHAPVAGQQRRAYASRTKLGSLTPQELASFQSIQDALSQPSTLVHHDPEKILWIDLDASNEFGFGAMIFHIAANEALPEGRWPSTTSVQPIFFLSRLLTSAERNYWPTELEIAGFVWVVKKVKHIIESSKSSVIIQTDHSAIIDILQQSSITSTISTMRLNLRLVRASQFLQQFKLNVRHKPGKEHIVPDALSRLASTSRHPDPEHSELDALFTYNTTFVEMHPALVSQILAGYRADPWWARLHRQIQENDDLGPNSAMLPFVVGSTPPADSDPYLTPRPGGNEDRSLGSTVDRETPEGLPSPDKTRLLYHVNRVTNVHRLCIPPSMARDILAVAHGKGHPGFSSCYEIISRSWYIRGLTKLLRAFIRHCP